MWWNGGVSQSSLPSAMFYCTPKSIIVHLNMLIMNTIIPNFYACKRCENVIRTMILFFSGDNCRVFCNTLTCNLCVVQKLNWKSTSKNHLLSIRSRQFQFSFYRMKAIPIQHFTFIFYTFSASFGICVFRLKLRFSHKITDNKSDLFEMTKYNWIIQSKWHWKSLYSEVQNANDTIHH